MWIRISKISVKQVDATHLKNPKNPGTPMTLNLYQAESRTVFFVIKSKKAFGEYLKTPTGTRIAKRKWSPQMEELARSESAKIPPLKGGFGWFEVVNIENDTYHIAKSVEMSDIAKPKEELNSSDFEEETSTVKAKELGAYHKAFASEDGLIEFTFSEKKE